MGSKPTQRALAHCRAKGWTAGIVEKWNVHAGIRQDLFGCIDLIVLDGQPGALGVQVTSGSNVAARITKSLAEPRLRTWLQSGSRFSIWGYRKILATKNDGSKSKRAIWSLREIELTLADLLHLE